MNQPQELGPPGRPKGRWHPRKDRGLCSTSREKGEDSSQHGQGSYSLQTQDAVLISNVSLKGLVPRSVGRWAQTSPLAQGLAHRQQGYRRYWTSPGHSWSQARGLGGSSARMLWGCLQQPAGTLGKWQDDTHHWWMKQECCSLPEFPRGIATWAEAAALPWSPSSPRAWPRAF